MILKVIFANSVDPDQTAPDLGPHCLPVCKNRFEKFARIFSRQHKQTTFSDAGFLGILRIRKMLHLVTLIAFFVNREIRWGQLQQEIFSGVACLNILEMVLWIKENTLTEEMYWFGISDHHYCSWLSTHVQFQWSWVFNFSLGGFSCLLLIIRPGH